MAAVPRDRQHVNPKWADSPISENTSHSSAKRKLVPQISVDAKRNVSLSSATRRPDLQISPAAQRRKGEARHPSTSLRAGLVPGSFRFRSDRVQQDMIHSVPTIVIVREWRVPHCGARSTEGSMHYPAGTDGGRNMPSLRSRQVEFTDTINAIFLMRSNPLICFSRQWRDAHFRTDRID